MNRIRITGYWASRSLATAHTHTLTPTARVRSLAQHAVFRAVMLSLDFLFWATKVRQWASRTFGWLWGAAAARRDGFEDEIERSMRSFAKSNFGVDIPENVFEG